VVVVVVVVVVLLMVEAVVVAEAVSRLFALTTAFLSVGERTNSGIGGTGGGGAASLGDGGGDRYGMARDKDRLAEEDLFLLR
jgi:hypothetical protein